VGWGNEQTTDWSQAAREKPSAQRRLGEHKTYHESDATIAARVQNLCELRDDATRLIILGLRPFPGDDLRVGGGDRAQL